MKRLTQLALACMIALSMVPLVAAQEAATQVIRLGDWVEIGPEAFMNIIATGDIRYRTTKNYDFEDRIEDRVPVRDVQDTLLTGQELDGASSLTLFGAEFRYQKNLQFQVYFRHDQIWDGNLSDGNSAGDENPGGPDRFGRPAEQELDTVNLERLWIDYQFPNTGLSFRVGYDYWVLDPGGFINDDDPRFAVFYRAGPNQALELQASAVINRESARKGLTNDNDYVYYTFGASYNLRPHRIGVWGAYHRDRDTGNTGTVRGQQIDSVLLMPAYSGAFGPVGLFLQGAVTFGKADSNSTVAREYDIISWAAAAYVDFDLGIVKPFAGIIYGSADDDPTDNDLRGFNPTTVGDSGVNFARLNRSHLDRTLALSERDVTTPARSKTLSTNAGLRRVLAGGDQFGHTVNSPFNDRIGNAEHAGITTAYSNPGTFNIFGGVQIFPIKGHEVNLWYLYRALADTGLIERAAQATDPGFSMSKHIFHELGVQWEWVLSRHFEIRLTGSIMLPGDGAKDLARTVDCDVATPGLQSCRGEDPAMRGEARFRAQF
jgi:hypothetical protein